MNALLSGLGGALTVTLLHESIRQVVPKAPRMDLLGREGISKIMLRSGHLPPPPDKLYWISMGGDVVANSLYYSLTGLGDRKDAVRNGALLGLAAGLGGVFLPGPMGLSRLPSARSVPTALMVVGLYLTAGMITGLLLRGKKKRQKPDPHLL